MESDIAAIYRNVEYSINCGIRCGKNESQGRRVYTWQALTWHTMVRPNEHLNDKLQRHCQRSPAFEHTLLPCVGISK